MTSINAHTLVNSKSTSFLRQAPQSAAPMLNDRTAFYANQQNYQSQQAPQKHSTQSINSSMLVRTVDELPQSTVNRQRATDFLS